MFYLYVNKYVAYFQRKIHLSRFSAYLDGSPFQLIWISEFYSIHDLLPHPTTISCSIQKEDRSHTSYSSPVFSH